ncbi:MAG: ABC transporter ATP-binding protein [Proteobacteria bacterium]|nr:ABC transporter ATP-binding protein [Pseudomonadota bacterium]
MSDAVLELKDIVRSYTQGGRTLDVLRRLNLRVGRGECLALVGPSGSGKTTLLQIAGLLDTPGEGLVAIGGQQMQRASDAERTRARNAHIGFVYQFHHLLPEFSALENVVMPQLIAGVARKEAEARAQELLAQLGLQDRVRHRPAALSGGEQQRVAIARALANKPGLLLADEPTGNLDPQTAEQVFALLLAQARGQGVGMLVATHNPELAARMDRTVRLEKGVLV